MIFSTACEQSSKCHSDHRYPWSSANTYGRLDLSLFLLGWYSLIDLYCCASLGQASYEFLGFRDHRGQSMFVCDSPNDDSSNSSCFSCGRDYRRYPSMTFKSLPPRWRIATQLASARTPAWLSFYSTWGHYLLIDMSLLFWSALGKAKWPACLAPFCCFHFAP